MLKKALFLGLLYAFCCPKTSFCAFANEGREGRPLQSFSPTLLQQQGRNAVQEGNPALKRMPGEEMRYSGEGHLPLPLALRLILPRSIKARYSPELRKLVVHVKGQNTPWTELLDSLAKRYGLRWKKDAHTNTVRLERLRKRSNNNGKRHKGLLEAEPETQGSHCPRFILTRAGKAALIANALNLPLTSFCAWNHIGAATPLPKGYALYIKKPAADCAVYANLPSWQGEGEAPSDLATETPLKESADAQKIALQDSPAKETAQKSAQGSRRIDNAQTTERKAKAKESPNKMAALENSVWGNDAKMSKPALESADKALPETTTGQSLAREKAQEKKEHGSREAKEPGGETHHFTLSSGLLSSGLRDWCKQVGYTLVWRGDFDIEIEQGGRFGTQFKEALLALQRALLAQGVPFRITLFTASRVLEIEDE